MCPPRGSKWPLRPLGNRCPSVGYPMERVCDDSEDLCLGLTLILNEISLHLSLSLCLSLSLSVSLPLPNLILLLARFSQSRVLCACPLGPSIQNQALYCCLKVSCPGWWGATQTVLPSFRSLTRSWGTAQSLCTCHFFCLEWPSLRWLAYAHPMDGSIFGSGATQLGSDCLCA